MTRNPREKTLADYARTVSRGRLIILLSAAICCGVALAISLVQRPSYVAQSSLLVQDPDSSAALAGAGVPSAQTPLQLALAHAPQVTRESVTRTVGASLRSPLSLDQLRGAVSVSVDPNSALVDIIAHAHTAAEAAAIANAFASSDAALTTAQARHQSAQQARQLASKLSRGRAARDPATQAIYASQLLRLQTLASVAAPVQVNATARVPTAPSSPRPVRNASAALLFGLLLGIAIVFARDALDRRLRQPGDVEEVLSHPIIGQISSEAFQRVATGWGSVQIDALDPIDQEAFRILRHNVRYLTAEPLKTLLVTSAMTEEGKSALAVNLAAVTASGGGKTLLVECDLRRPVLRRRLGLPAGPGLSDYLTDNADWAAIIRTLPVKLVSRNGSDPSGSPPESGADGALSCVTAGTTAPRPTELIASRRFREFLAEAKESYDNIVLDCAPLLSVADTLEIVPEVSGLIVCVRLAHTTRDQVRAVQTALDRLPSRPVGIVLTDVPRHLTSYYEHHGAKPPERSVAAARP